MTRDSTKGYIVVADQESARYVTRDELTRRPKRCTMGAMLRIDTRGIYKRWTKISTRNKDIQKLSRIG